MPILYYKADRTKIGNSAVAADWPTNTYTLYDATGGGSGLLSLSPPFAASGAAFPSDGQRFYPVLQSHQESEFYVAGAAVSVRNRLSCTAQAMTGCSARRTMSITLTKGNRAEPVGRRPFETMRKHGRQSGLTLTELVVTVAIAAILLSIAVPAVKRLTASLRDTAGTQGLINAALSNARAIAVRQQKYAGVRFQTGRRRQRRIWCLLCMTMTARDTRTVFGRWKAARRWRCRKNTGVSNTIASFALPNFPILPAFRLCLVRRESW